MIRRRTAVFSVSSLILIFFASLNASAGWMIDKENIPKNTYTPATGTATTATIVQGLNSLGETCQKRAELARKVCFESLNPDIQAAGPYISAAVAAGTGMTDACSNMGKALKAANTALTAFNVACSAAKVACDTACSTAQKKVPSTTSELNTQAGAISTTNSAESNQILNTVIKNEIPNSQKSITVLEQECLGHARRLMSAGAGIMAIIAEAQKTNQCEEQTAAVNCTLTPDAESCKTQIDCSLAENQQKTECICARAPATPGCPSSGLAGGDGSYQQQGAGGYDSVGAGDGDGNINLSTNGMADGFISPNGSGGGGGSGGANGESGRGGPLAGGAAGKAKSADGAQKTLNPNILSGYEGGGGGGAWGKGGSGAGSEYQAYMPGGKNDPSRNVASQVFANGEVTGGGGKSNWEKVRDRYRDNRPNLLVGP